MNLNVSLPPPYTREAWQYKKADKKKYPQKYKNLLLGKIVHKLNNKWESGISFKHAN